jgi:hypothetical protein
VASGSLNIYSVFTVGCWAFTLYLCFIVYTIDVAVATLSSGKCSLLISVQSPNGVNKKEIQGRS